MLGPDKRLDAGFDPPLPYDKVAYQIGKSEQILREHKPPQIGVPLWALRTPLDQNMKVVDGEGHQGN